MGMLRAKYEVPGFPDAVQRLPVFARLDGDAQIASRSLLGYRMQLLDRPSAIGRRQCRRRESKHRGANLAQQIELSFCSLERPRRRHVATVIRVSKGSI